LWLEVVEALLHAEEDEGVVLDAKELPLFHRERRLALLESRDDRVQAAARCRTALLRKRADGQRSTRSDCKACCPGEPLRRCIHKTSSSGHRAPFSRSLSLVTWC